jgi:16S rRNA pseudouridine516 synthase
MSKGATTLRLDRLLANLGYGSRREVQQLVYAGLVQLDGEVLEDADQRVAISPDLSGRMTVQGRPLDPPPGMVLIMHKPCGVTCSHKEPGALVYDLLPPRWRRREPALSTIGRLDKDTSGLLLFTDDGALLHRVISPRNHVAKRYLVTLDRPLRGDEGALFASGALLLEGEDKPLLPATLEPLSPTRAWLTVTEGRYHQVRRMFAAAGNHVAALHRDRVGALELPPDLDPGSYHLLGPDETASIFRKGEPDGQGGSPELRALCGPRLLPET